MGETQPVVLAIVGAGPTGTSLLERLFANLPSLLPSVPVVVHVIDPHPPGAGRVWRTAQSALLRMNSMAEDVTMFVDDSVTCEGPAQPGPTLSEWIELARHDETIGDADLAEELRTSTPTSFPTRHLQSAYLSWVYERVLADAPATVTIEEHDASAVGLEDAGSGAQWVHLDDGTSLVADVVVLTIGHLDVKPNRDERELGSFAARHGLAYVPPAYTADVDLEHIPDGAVVVSRGMGLAFVDLVVLLTEGRGGRFVDDGDDLRYLPSGREPRIVCGSRRGVPYHSKIGYPLRGPRPELPNVLRPDVVEAALADRKVLDFHRDVWPLVAAELTRAHYHELFVAHSDRVRAGWSDVERHFERY
ncbi:MAG: FAD/NAD(P)-binding protein, partial [Acidimicrobiia bacterium]|nr:FAD/NAD(P)-binding protein [Acidimicrobiia bacterium]